MTERLTNTSPRAQERIAGACYLAIFVAGYIYSAPEATDQMRMMTSRMA